MEDSLGGGGPSGSNTITSLSNRLSGGMGMGMGASEVARVMTPPLVIGNGHRPKQPAAGTGLVSRFDGTYFLFSYVNFLLARLNSENYYRESISHGCVRHTKR